MAFSRLLYPNGGLKPNGPRLHPTLQGRVKQVESADPDRASLSLSPCRISPHWSMFYCMLCILFTKPKNPKSTKKKEKKKKSRTSLTATEEATSESKPNPNFLFEVSRTTRPRGISFVKRSAINQWSRGPKPETQAPWAGGRGGGRKRGSLVGVGVPEDLSCFFFFFLFFCRSDCSVARRTTIAPMRGKKGLRIHVVARVGETFLFFNFFFFATWRVYVRRFFFLVGGNSVTSIWWCRFWKGWWWWCVRA